MSSPTVLSGVRGASVPGNGSVRGGECGGVAGCIQFFFEGEKQFFDVDFVETQVAEGAVVGQLRDVDAEMVG